MYVPTNTPKYVCTGCKTKIPIVDLEGIFLDELKGYLMTPEKVATYLSKASDEVTEKAKLLETLQKELQKVKQQAEQTYQLYLANGLTVPQFKEIYQPLDARKIQIEAELPRIQGEVDLLRVNGLSSEHIMTEAIDLYDRWPKMNSDEKRRIVESFVKEIIIGKEEITLNLCYLPSYEEMTNRQRML